MRPSCLLINTIESDNFENIDEKEVHGVVNQNEDALGDGEQRYETDGEDDRPNETLSEKRQLAPLPSERMPPIEVNPLMTDTALTNTND